MPVQLTDSQKVPENDLDKAFLALSGKLSGYNDLWAYYDGDQPLMYTAKRMRDLFSSLDLETFVENWCAVVIDSALDRIVLESLTIENAAAQEQLTLDWDDFGLALEANETHEAAMVIGESFVIVWEEIDEFGEAELQVFHNDPRLCHLFYEPGNPRKKQFGAKWWVDSESFTRMILYYPDRLEYYRTRKAGQKIEGWKAFEPFDPRGEEGGEEIFEDDDGTIFADNEYDEIPLFHFRLERRLVKSDLKNAIPLQNANNKLITDMMVAAEFGAFKQRWIISNADTKNMKNAPNIIWEIPAGEGEGQRSSVGQFDATELENYIKAMNKVASSLATITRTPKHYLFGQAGDPSGEALIAMEAPLNKRCSEHIDRFIPTWKEVAQFILKIRGTEIPRRDIVVNFEDPETVQPKAQADIRQLGRSAGIPLKTLLRDEGKNEAWIEQMEKDKKDAEDASPMLALLDQVRRNRAPGGEE